MKRLILALACASLIITGLGGPGSAQPAPTTTPGSDFTDTSRTDTGSAGDLDIALTVPQFVCVGQPAPIDIAISDSGGTGTDGDTSAATAAGRQASRSAGWWYRLCRTSLLVVSLARVSPDYRVVDQTVLAVRSPAASTHLLVPPSEVPGERLIVRAYLFTGLPCGVADVADRVLEHFPRALGNLLPLLRRHAADHTLVRLEATAIALELSVPSVVGVNEITPLTATVIGTGLPVPVRLRLHPPSGGFLVGPAPLPLSAQDVSDPDPVLETTIHGSATLPFVAFEPGDYQIAAELNGTSWGEPLLVAVKADKEVKILCVRIIFVANEGDRTNMPMGMKGSDAISNNPRVMYAGNPPSHFGTITDAGYRATLATMIDKISARLLEECCIGLELEAVLALDPQGLSVMATNLQGQRVPVAIRDLFCHDGNDGEIDGDDALDYAAGHDPLSELVERDLESQTDRRCINVFISQGISGPEAGWGAVPLAGMGHGRVSAIGENALLGRQNISGPLPPARGISDVQGLGTDNPRLDAAAYRRDVCAGPSRWRLLAHELGHVCGLPGDNSPGGHNMMRANIMRDPIDNVDELAITARQCEIMQQAICSRLADLGNDPATGQRWRLPAWCRHVEADPDSPERIIGGDLTRQVLEDFLTCLAELASLEQALPAAARALYRLRSAILRAGTARSQLARTHLPALCTKVELAARDFRSAQEQAAIKELINQMLATLREYQQQVDMLRANQVAGVDNPLPADCRRMLTTAADALFDEIARLETEAGRRVVNQRNLTRIKQRIADMPNDPGSATDLGEQIDRAADKINEAIEALPDEVQEQIEEVQQKDDRVSREERMTGKTRETLEREAREALEDD